MSMLIEIFIINVVGTSIYIRFVDVYKIVILKLLNNKRLSSYVNNRKLYES